MSSKTVDNVVVMYPGVTLERLPERDVPDSAPTPAAAVESALQSSEVRADPSDPLSGMSLDPQLSPRRKMRGQRLPRPPKGVCMKSRAFPRSPFPTEVYLRTMAPPEIWPVIKELADQNLYPGLMDFFAAMSSPTVARHLHHFYEKGGRRLSEAFDAIDLDTLDQAISSVIVELEVVCAEVRARHHMTSDRRDVIRWALREHGFRVRPWCLGRYAKAAQIPGAEAEGSHLIPLHTGVLLDGASNLIWARFDESPRGDWEAAVEQARTYEVDGGGWKLPTEHQVRTLTHVDGVSPDTWVWLREPGFNIDFGRCARIDGLAQDHHKSWVRQIWLVKCLEAGELEERLDAARRFGNVEVDVEGGDR